LRSGRFLCYQQSPVQRKSALAARTPCSYKPAHAALPQNAWLAPTRYSARSKPPATCQERREKDRRGVACSSAGFWTSGSTPSDRRSSLVACALLIRAKITGFACNFSPVSCATTVQWRCVVSDVYAPNCGKDLLNRFAFAYSMCRALWI
jgi:hypothetical protein